MTTHLDADVIIIGGGGAGANAALKAHELGLDVVLVVKGLLGRSGCSIFAGNLHLPHRLGPPTEQATLDLLTTKVRYWNHYLVDEDYCLAVEQYALDEFYPELERSGLYIRRYDDGAIVTSRATPSVIVAANKQGDSGRILMDLRRKQILAKGIRVLEQTMATSILVEGGEAVGICALDFTNGRFYAIRAKAVILATGQSDQIATRSTGTREQCANGIAMAYRAGAEMQNLEIQWWHISDFAQPRSWMRLHNYPNPLIGTDQVARHYNSRGEMFFDATQVPLSSAPYPQQLRTLALEVKRGLAQWDRGYCVGYDHIDPHVMKKYDTTAAFYEKLGLDVGKDRVECGISWHMRQGGISTDPRTMKTSVPGLLVAGAVGGHYLCGIVPVSYDGKVAAHGAYELALGRGLPPFPEAQIEAERRRVFGWLRTEPATGHLPIRVKKEIRAVMWDHMGYVKSERGMQEGLEKLRRIRNEMLPRMRLVTTTTNWNHAWVDALDVEDLLVTCEITILSALYRKESRGPFYREDYPFTDHKNWLRHVILKRKGRDGDLDIRTVPVQLKYVNPPGEREDFFETDY